MLNAFLRPARHCAFLASLLVVAAAPPSQAADIPALILAAPCAACHGAEGASVGPVMPTLAGMNYQYFLSTMLSYQRDKRKGTVMNRVAKGYTEDELEAMAEYFEELKFQPAKQDFDKALAARGKELHPKYCQEKCHQKGRGDHRGRRHACGPVDRIFEEYTRRHARGARLLSEEDEGRRGEAG